MLRMRKQIPVFFLIFTILCLSGVQGRMLDSHSPSKEITANKSAATPGYAIVAHRVNRLSLSVTNYGLLGTGFLLSPPIDFFTGEPVPSCEYPKGKGVEYLFGGAIWVGAVVNGDTLVSQGTNGWTLGREYAPDASPFGDIIYRNASDPNSVSDEDYITVYYDTLTASVENDFFGRPHIPLNIEITQSSYSWSPLSYITKEPVLINFMVKNIGDDILNDVYFGFYMDNDIITPSNTMGYNDDITGYISSADVNFGTNCIYNMPVQIAWAADNDGELADPDPANNAMGLTILNPHIENVNFSYNWWISNGNASLDFGPREHSGVGIWPEDFRDFMTGGIGTPEGDVNKYYIMRNQEIDYDQVYTASISTADPLWMYPDQSIALDFSVGTDTRYLLSFGPISSIAPGQSYPVTVAVVPGKYFHSVEGNVSNLPNDPDTYYSNLNFNGLKSNAVQANWAYDNPGVDTDGDSYFGEYILCDNDTLWVKGDGVPDYRWLSSYPPCCVGIRGNIDSDFNDTIDIADIVYLIAYMFAGGPMPHCPEEIDVNGDGQIDVHDLVDLINYSFNYGPAPIACP